MVKYSTINAIPTMTSNTSPSGVASVSKFYLAGYDAWYLFDKKNDTGYMVQWETGLKMSYQFSESKIISKYTLTNFVGQGLTRNPKDWTFEGSNDGVNWTILDTQIGQTSWSDGVKREYLTNNNNSYTTYRINVSANNGDASWFSLGEIEMFEVELEKRMTIKNKTTQKIYSLDNQTLINLPSSSDKNMILYGVETGTEVQLDVPFDKMKYVDDTSEVLGVGKTYTHSIDMTKTKVNKLIL